MTQTFARGAIPPTERFDLYRKRHLTHAVRIDGPFRVETAEGPLDCPDGWLALDSRGYPYPIAADEFAAIYVRAD
jgi:hypothetical protein